MSSAEKKILVATRNPGKLREFTLFFAPWGYTAVGLDAFPELPPVVEDGKTFQENAQKKASMLYEYTQMPVLADDSGLEVDALAGRPGVYSARYAGEGASDESNNRKLLRELKDVPWAKRRARFRCVLNLQMAASQMIEVEGAVEGMILNEPRGSGGFGYDPLFYLPDRGVAMAELSTVEKNRLSHRGQALKKLKRALQHLFS